MQLFDGAGLKLVNKILGLSSRPSAETFLDSESVQQALNMNAFVRRGRAYGAADGMFAWTIENVHPGIDTQTTTIDPYALASVAAGFPTPVPEGFDVWLLDAQVSVTTANVDLDPGPRLSIVFGSTLKVFGPAGSVTIPWRLWNTVIPISGTLGYMGVSAGFPHRDAAWRIPRGATLTFASTSLAATSIFCGMAIALLPAGLGQDAIGAG